MVVSNVSVLNGQLNTEPFKWCPRPNISIVSLLLCVLKKRQALTFVARNFRIYIELMPIEKEKKFQEVGFIEILAII